jgi:hypothetical protein
MRGKVGSGLCALHCRMVGGSLTTDITIGMDGMFPRVVVAHTKRDFADLPESLPGRQDTIAG